MHKNQNFFGGYIAFLTGGSVSLSEIITSGSLALTFIGALLAVIGGWWAYRSSKLKYEVAVLDHKIRKIEFNRMKDKE